MKIQNFTTFLILTFISCTEEGDSDRTCTDTAIATTSLEKEYACTQIALNLSDSNEDDYLIIRDQLDFDEFVSASCQETIDFSTYDLVIGQERLQNGLNSIEYELIEDCETSDQILTVTFNLLGTTEAPVVTYNVLIPKLGNQQDLCLESNTN